MTSPPTGKLRSGLRPCSVNVDGAPRDQLEHEVGVEPHDVVLDDLPGVAEAAAAPRGGGRRCRCPAAAAASRARSWPWRPRSAPRSAPCDCGTRAQPVRSGGDEGADARPVDARRAPARRSPRAARRGPRAWRRARCPRARAARRGSRRARAGRGRSSRARCRCASRAGRPGPLSVGVAVGARGGRAVVDLVAVELRARLAVGHAHEPRRLDLAQLGHEVEQAEPGRLAAALDAERDRARSGRASAARRRCRARARRPRRAARSRRPGRSSAASRDRRACSWCRGSRSPPRVSSSAGVRTKRAAAPSGANSSRFAMRGSATIAIAPVAAGALQRDAVLLGQRHVEPRDDAERRHAGALLEPLRARARAATRRRGSG